MSPVTTPPAERATVLTAYEVTELQSQRAYPSISILATTRPGPTLHGEDVSALRGLAADAARRLAAEHTDHLDADPEQLLAAVHELIGEAAGRPTNRAVALFVSATERRRVNLPVPVVNRCVIDPTFATRDLVRALQHTPHHAVLLLSADETRLLHDRGGILTRVTSGGFPVRRRTLGARRSSADERPPTSCAASTAHSAWPCAWIPCRWCSPRPNRPRRGSSGCPATPGGWPASCAAATCTPAPRS